MWVVYSSDMFDEVYFEQIHDCMLHNDEVIHLDNAHTRNKSIQGNGWESNLIGQLKPIVQFLYQYLKRTKK